MDKTFSSHLTKDNYSKIIYTEEINLEFLSEEARNSLNIKLAEYKKLFGPNLRVEINKNNLVYDTEILVPTKKHQDRTKGKRSFCRRSRSLGFNHSGYIGR